MPVLPVYSNSKGRNSLRPQGLINQAPTGGWEGAWGEGGGATAPEPSPQRKFSCLTAGPPAPAPRLQRSRPR
jgi:hypothetical protein